MKPIVRLAIVATLVVAVGVAALAADDATPKNTEGGYNIHFPGVPVDVVLDTYKTTTKLELVVASDIRFATHLIILDVKGASADGAQRLMEQALLKQAGVVITRLDNDRVSVTYNDRLEVKP
jgi:hypothetical protein